MKSNSFNSAEIGEIYEIALIALSNFKNEIADEMDLDDEYLFQLKNKIYDYLNN